jgi:Flp pilus assembly protein TadG
MGRRKERGQSVVELALILPLLIVIAIGVVEAGYAMRNHLVVSAANREGIRFAARGRFTEASVADRVIAAGGVGRQPDTTFLRSAGDTPNTGIILTHIPIQADGTVLTRTVYVSGTVSFSETRQVTTADSRVDAAGVISRTVSTADQINDDREAAGYERLSSDIIVLEVFYEHETLWVTHFVPSSPWMMYTRSVMRVVSDSRVD